MFVMISYDVPAKRTGVYKRLLKEFLVHEQASVFMGDLPESEVIKLVAKIVEQPDLITICNELANRTQWGQNSRDEPKQKS